ncbi:unnamed protein product [Symbiodinium sp. CCMP2456]|nr:unnamed protein product [Symbiodinium sp. CCMP2456]
MDGDRLQAVLARCRRIRGGAETLSNLPPQLAERLKSLYAKCERLKQAKDKTDTPESGSPALAVEESGSEGEEGVEPEDTAEVDKLPGSDLLHLAVQALLGRDGWDGLAENADRQPEQDDNTATFDPYLLEDADGVEEAEEVEEDSATEASDWEDCAAWVHSLDADSQDWTDLPIGTTFDADGAASYSVARKLGQSQGIITYAVNCKGENYVAKFAANGPQAAARRRSGEAADADVVLQNVSVDVFDVSSFVKTLAEVMADFGVSQLAAPAPAAAPAKRAAPASQPGPAMLVPTEAAPQPETATFKRLFHEPGKPEEPSPEKVKTLFGEAADVQPKRQMSLDKSCFKVLFREPALETAPTTKEEGTRPEGSQGQAELLAPAFAKFPCVAGCTAAKAKGSSPERSPPVGQEPAGEVWYKAPPPKKTLSSMLSSYEEEEEDRHNVSGRWVFFVEGMRSCCGNVENGELHNGSLLWASSGGASQEPLEPETAVERLGVRPRPWESGKESSLRYQNKESMLGLLLMRLESVLRNAAAGRRRSSLHARVRPVLDEAPSIEDIRAHNISARGGLLPGSVWDPATGQFVSEPIPDDILQSFKKEKDLKLEDYQERVLMAQLAEKKRRLEPLG